MGRAGVLLPDDQRPAELVHGVSARPLPYIKPEGGLCCVIVAVLLYFCCVALSNPEMGGVLLILHSYVLSMVFARYQIVFVRDAFSISWRFRGVFMCFPWSS